MNDKIWFVFDIDGVITDGRVLVGKNGEEQKCLNFKDIDAVYELSRRGYSIAAMTAECNELTEWFRHRFPWKQFFAGENKLAALQKLKEEHKIEPGCLVYIGDGRKDLLAFAEADYRVCPSDAIVDIRRQATVVLQQPAGTGVLWELVELADKWFGNAKRPPGLSLWEKNIEDHLALTKALQQDTRYHKAVIAAAEIIVNAIQSRQRVLILGNGGSAADAQHIAAEFMGRFQREREAWEVEALTVNTSLLTAVANDYTYDEVFSRQIRGIVKPRDVVIGISTSGRSKSVLSALDAAKKLSGTTLLMTGKNVCCSIADIVLNVPSDSVARIQEMHILTGHFWAQYAEDVLAGAKEATMVERHV